MEINDISGQIVDVAYKLHVALGSLLLEHVYETCMAHDLSKRGLLVERQKPCMLCYDGITFPEAFRVDLLVEGKVVVEIKSLPALSVAHEKQVLTYLKLLDCRLGLLLNFGAPLMREGIKRLANR